MAKRLPFIGSGRVQEGGELAARKQDLLAHAQGTGFRHTADNIDMNPVLENIDGYSVQEALENLLSSITSSGSGFISIGSISGNLGSYNVGSSATPLLSDAFSAAFADSRLSNGGTILLLSGTYNLTVAEQIVVPSGITIMGELDGTIISKTGIDKSMFKILESSPTSMGFNSGSNYFADGMMGKVTKLFNLTLIDNFGGVTDKEPCLISSPMIECNVRSNFECEYVRFLGRIGEGSPPAITSKAIGYVGISSSQGTFLNVQRCYFDGLRIGIDFIPTQDSGNDYIVVNNCKARTSGNYTDNSPEFNCFVNMSNSTAVFTNNYHMGSGDPTYCFVVSDGSSYDGITYSITGNSGGGYRCQNIFTVTAVYSNVLYTVKSGNNWGSSINNEWFVTVGMDGYGSSGDFVGAYAISYLFLTASGPTTCIVNPGTYEIISSNNNSPYNDKNIKFIGNPTKEKPIFLLNIVSSNPTDNDVLDRKTLFVGHELKNIKFKSKTSFQSVTVTGKEFYNIDNCEFENAGLVVQNNGFQDPNYPDYSISINITNTKFSQGSGYCNVSMLLPKADNVTVENCKWTGSGYAGEIGSFTNYESNVFSCNVSVANCYMSLSDGDISVVPPGAVSKNYFSIDINGSVKFNHNTVTVSDDLSARNNVISTPMDFASFVRIAGQATATQSNIIFENNIINGPNQTYLDGANTFSMSSCEFYVNNLYCNNNTILNGCTPIKVFTEGNAESIVISNNVISISDVNYNTSATAIYVYSYNQDGFVPKVLISNNNILNRQLTSRINISPIVASSANTDAMGVIFIYYEDSDIEICGNIVESNQTMINATDYTYSSILVKKKVKSNIFNFISIHDNKIGFDPVVYFESDHANSCYEFSGINVDTSKDVKIYNNSIRIGSSVDEEAEQIPFWYGIKCLIDPVSSSNMKVGGIINANTIMGVSYDDSLPNTTDYNECIYVVSGSPKGIINNNLSYGFGDIVDSSGNAWVKTGNIIS